MLNKEDLLLILLMEEASEVAQAASKMLRFGHNHGTNKENLIKELIDLEAVICLLIEENILPLDYINAPDYNNKRTSIDYYMGISKKLNRLAENV